jgi:hypothetical protein
MLRSTRYREVVLTLSKNEALLQSSYCKAVELASHGVNVCEWQRVCVGAIGEEDEDALVVRIDPDARAGEAVVTETVRRKIDSTG